MKKKISKPKCQVKKKIKTKKNKYRSPSEIQVKQWGKAFEKLARRPPMEFNFIRPGISGDPFDLAGNEEKPFYHKIVNPKSTSTFMPLQPATRGELGAAPADAVNHPSHYNSHPSGIECIQIAQYYGFNIGNVIKYCWRAGLKDGTKDIEDLKKAAWYLNQEIKLREQTKL